MIEAIKNGDESAFGQAYKQWSDKTYSYFLLKTRNPEDARDLLQTTFLKLWQYRETLSAEYLLEQHLFHIARTVFIDYLRRENKKERVITAVADHLTAQFTEAHPAVEFETRARLESALSTIPEMRRRVFELHRLEGYSYREIARILSITVKAADNNLSKAVRQLRKVFLFL